MADPLKTAIDKLKGAMPKDLAKGSDTEKAFAAIEKALTKADDSYAPSIDKLLAALKKDKKKVAKDKDGKKKIEELEKVAADDKKKRLTAKDNSTSPV